MVLIKLKDGVWVNPEHIVNVISTSKQNIYTLHIHKTYYVHMSDNTEHVLTEAEFTTSLIKYVAKMQASR